MVRKIRPSSCNIQKNKIYNNNIWNNLNVPTPTAENTIESYSFLRKHTSLSFRFKLSVFNFAHQLTKSQLVVLKPGCLEVKMLLPELLLCLGSASLLKKNVGDAACRYESPVPKKTFNIDYLKMALCPKSRSLTHFKIAQKLSKPL